MKMQGMMVATITSSVYLPYPEELGLELVGFKVGRMLVNDVSETTMSESSFSMILCACKGCYN